MSVNNAEYSSAPSSLLLSKLDELRKWQEAQQNKLLQMQPATRLNASDNYSFRNRLMSTDIHKALISDDAISPNQRPDEEKPSETSKNTSPVFQTSAKIVKRPYLKRGTGLSKYGLQYGEHTKPSNKMKPQTTSRKAVRKKSNQTVRNARSHSTQAEKHLKEYSCHKEKIVSKITQQEPDSYKEKLTNEFLLNSDHLTPLKAPEMKLLCKAKWCPPSLEAEIDQSDPQLVNEMLHGEDACNLQAKFDEMKSPGPSAALMNNPILLDCLQKLADAHFGPQNESAQDLLSKLTLSNTFETPNNTNCINADLLAFLQNLARNPESTPVGDLTKYERALEKELHVFERIEQNLMNNSFNSVNSSLFELLASTPKKAVMAPAEEIIQETICAQNTQKSSETEKDPPHAKKMLVYAEVNEDSSVTSDDFHDTLHENRIENAANCEQSREVIIRQNASTNTDPISEQSDEELRMKLAELDKEIANFRSETKKLRQLQNDLETESLGFHTMKRSWEKDFQDTREHYEFEIEEERKKLMKEKTQFERYVKELHARPNRKEREEIANLKQELENVREKLKLKETRSGTSQARLRNQIKGLEKDNHLLKDDLESVQKQYAKLQAQQASNSKKTNVDTKMLHEINRNLTKLTNDTKIVKQLNKIETAIEEKEQYEDHLTVIKSNKGKNDCLGVKSRKRMTNCDSSSHSRRNTKESNEESDDSFSHSRRSSRGRKSRENKTFDKTHSTEESSDEETAMQSRYSENKRTVRNRQSKRNDNHSGALSCSRYKMDSKVDSPLQEMENKENEENCSTGDITTFRNLSNLSVTEHYDKIFGNKHENDAHSRKLRRNQSINDTQLSNGAKVETIMPDGSKETKYPNGNIKIVSNDGNVINLKYFNGDIKETHLKDGTVRYFYKETQIWQTTATNGDEIFDFPDGQTEKHFADGSAFVQFPNGIIKQVQTDGSEEIQYPDGSVVNIKMNGEKVLMLPNGQKEIHTESQKSREYPDGTVKIIYPDGLQETRYSNGRIRMKDKDGNLIMDSHKEC